MSLSIFFKKIKNTKNPLIIEKMEVDFFVSRNLNKKKNKFNSGNIIAFRWDYVT